MLLVAASLKRSGLKFWMYSTGLFLENKEKEVSPSILAAATKISWQSANKAIIYGEIGLIPPGMKQGHGRVGIGAMIQLEMHHHLYIYELYLRNPSRPLISYCEKLERKYDKKVSEMTISRWFKTIGPFKGTMRLTLKYPPGKSSWETRQLLEEYLAFVG